MGEDQENHYFEYQAEMVLVWKDEDCEEIFPQDVMVLTEGPIWICGNCGWSTYDEEAAVKCCQEG